MIRVVDLFGNEFPVPSDGVNSERDLHRQISSMYEIDAASFDLFCRQRKLSGSNSSGNDNLSDDVRNGSIPVSLITKAYSERLHSYKVSPCFSAEFSGRFSHFHFPSALPPKPADAPRPGAAAAGAGDSAAARETAIELASLRESDYDMLSVDDLFGPFDGFGWDEDPGPLPAGHPDAEGETSEEDVSDEEEECESSENGSSGDDSSGLDGDLRLGGGSESGSSDGVEVIEVEALSPEQLANIAMWERELGLARETVIQVYIDEDFDVEATAASLRRIAQRGRGF